MEEYTGIHFCSGFRVRVATALSREGEQGRWEKAGFKSRLNRRDPQRFRAETLLGPRGPIVRFEDVSPGLDGSRFLVTN